MDTPQVMIVGPQTQSDGINCFHRAGKSGEGVISELHGQSYEQCYRGYLYSYGLSDTALVAANAIATGLTATAQPVVGVYNPSNSGYNMVILQATIITTTISNTAVAPGGFMWVCSAGNGVAVSTGSTPVNCKTLTAAGSIGKAFAVSTALTGLVTSLVALRAAAITPSLNAAGAATAVSLGMGQITEIVNGGLICPPGGVLGIMNQIATTTMKVSVAIVWEEVPI